jgi:hypothetical protein
MARGLTFLLSLMVLAAAVLGTRTVGSAAEDQAKQDLAAFKAYLEKERAGKKWQTGPTRLDSEELRQAYGKRRFYFVFSAPPIPPGAFSPQIQKQFQERAEDFRKNYLSLTVGFDEKGKIVPLLKAEDYNVGLMPIKTDDDARVAAAAILSLASSDAGIGGAGPGVVAASEVQVARTKDGWSCTAARRFRFQGTVAIDPAGKVFRVSKISTLPPPP